MALHLYIRVFTKVMLSTVNPRKDHLSSGIRLSTDQGQGEGFVYSRCLNSNPTFTYYGKTSKT